MINTTIDALIESLDIDKLDSLVRTQKFLETEEFKGFKDSLDFYIDEENLEDIEPMSDLYSQFLDSVEDNLNIVLDEIFCILDELKDEIDNSLNETDKINLCKDYLLGVSENSDIDIIIDCINKLKESNKIVKSIQNKKYYNKKNNKKIENKKISNELLLSKIKLMYFEEHKSNRAIAKELNISKDTVANKVKKLKENNNDWRQG